MCQVHAGYSYAVLNSFALRKLVYGEVVVIRSYALPSSTDIFINNNVKNIGYMINSYQNILQNKFIGKCADQISAKSQ